MPAINIPSIKLAISSSSLKCNQIGAWKPNSHLWYLSPFPLNLPPPPPPPPEVVPSDCVPNGVPFAIMHYSWPGPKVAQWGIGGHLGRNLCGSNSLKCPSTSMCIISSRLKMFPFYFWTCVAHPCCYLCSLIWPVGFHGYAAVLSLRIADRSSEHGFQTGTFHVPYPSRSDLNYTFTNRSQRRGAYAVCYTKWKASLNVLYCIFNIA